MRTLVVKKLLVITPIEHIDGLVIKLQSAFELTICPDPKLEDIAEILPEYHAVFTNPNKSKIKISKDFMDLAINLDVIVTASTGLVHIDIEYARSNNIPVISLTKEYDTINKISSTAEHALAMTLALVRNLCWAVNDVSKERWDYERFIGRQMNVLTVGVLGYGRLGKMYAGYVEALGSKVLVCDPAYDADSCPYEIVNIEGIFRRADIIALHIHASKENTELINKKLLSLAKRDVMIINTSRGEIINESDMVSFLRANPDTKLATDVLSDEQNNKWGNLIYKFFIQGGNQVIITPHVGGMCKEAQEIAYHRVADMLIENQQEPGNRISGQTNDY
jgi:D-3-phosphoglycerate dehydrogenase